MDAHVTNATPDKSQPTLSRERVLTEALALIDEQGFVGFTMRDLAARLACTDMALYHYVRNRDELLEGVVELILGRIEILQPGQGLEWDQALFDLHRSLWAVFRAHPQALPALLARPLTLPAMVRCFTGARAVLLGSGFDEEAAKQLLDTLSAYTLGYANLVCGGYLSIDKTQPQAPPPRTRSRKRRGTGCPGLEGEPDWDGFERGFETGLAAVLRGLREEAQERRERSR